MWGLVKFIGKEILNEMNQAHEEGKARQRRRDERNRRFHAKYNECQQWANHLAEHSGQDYHHSMSLCKERGWKKPKRGGL